MQLPLYFKEETLYTLVGELMKPGHLDPSRSMWEGMKDRGTHRYGRDRAIEERALDR